MVALIDYPDFSVGGCIIADRDHYIWKEGQRAPINLNENNCVIMSVKGK